jgi:hypothetical protein
MIGHKDILGCRVREIAGDIGMPDTDGIHPGCIPVEAGPVDEVAAWLGWKEGGYCYEGQDEDHARDEEYEGIDTIDISEDLYEQGAGFRGRPFY